MGYDRDGVEYKGVCESADLASTPILAPDLGNAWAELAEIVAAGPNLGNDVRQGSPDVATCRTRRCLVTPQKGAAIDQCPTPPRNHGFLSNGVDGCLEPSIVIDINHGAICRATVDSFRPRTRTFVL